MSSYEQSMVAVLFLMFFLTAMIDAGNVRTLRTPTTPPSITHDDNNAVGGSCRDRYGALGDPTHFRRRSCSFCYIFLFPGSTAAYTARPPDPYLYKNVVVPYFSRSAGPAAANQAATEARPETLSNDAVAVNESANVSEQNNSASTSLPQAATAGATFSSIRLDPVNPVDFDTVCQSMSATDCWRWKTCCSEAVACCDRMVGDGFSRRRRERLPFESVPTTSATDTMATERPFLRTTSSLGGVQNMYPRAVGNQSYGGVGNGDDDIGHCEMTWDGFGCWPATSSGVTETLTCPAFLPHSQQFRKALKHCTQNGTWYEKDGLSWTDYTRCLDISSYKVNIFIAVGFNVLCLMVLIPAILVLCFNVLCLIVLIPASLVFCINVLCLMVLIPAILVLCFNVLCLMVLIPAILVFCVFRDLRHQLRVRVHVHFFTSLTLSSLVSLTWNVLVDYELLTNPVSTETVIARNEVWCRLLSVLKIYTTSSTYCWMLSEGCYLHRLLSRVFEQPESLVGFYLLGWVAPAVTVGIYAAVRLVINSDSCWAINIGELEWIIYAPNLLCLAVNLIFLCNILRILLFQLHAHPSEPNNFRRGLKAGIMLVPLFGLQLLLTIYRPDANVGGQKHYEYVTLAVTNSQGVFVALIFCFFNSEVMAHFCRHRSCPSSCCCCCCCCVRRRTSRLFSTSQMQSTRASVSVHCINDDSFSMTTKNHRGERHQRRSETTWSLVQQVTVRIPTMDGYSVVEAVAQDDSNPPSVVVVEPTLIVTLSDLTVTVEGHDGEQLHS